MKKHFTLTLVSLCAVLALPNLASAEEVIHSSAGGAVQFHPNHGTAKADGQKVKRDLAEFQRNPFSPDGQFRYVGGELGWLLVQHEYALKDGQWQHADRLGHNTPAPSLQMTPKERKERDALYFGA